MGGTPGGCGSAALPLSADCTVNTGRLRSESLRLRTRRQSQVSRAAGARPAGASRRVFVRARAPGEAPGPCIGPIRRGRKEAGPRHPRCAPRIPVRKGPRSRPVRGGRGSAPSPGPRPIAVGLGVVKDPAVGRALASRQRRGEPGPTRLAAPCAWLAHEPPEWGTGIARGSARRAGSTPQNACAIAWAIPRGNEPGARGPGAPAP